MDKRMLGCAILISMIAPCIAIQPIKADASPIVIPDDYATIQSAINMAGDGDRIFVRSGVYHENLQINKSISLIGQDMNSTIIDGNWSEGYLRPITITHDNVSVTGFGLSNSWTGISLDKVSGCQILGNKLTNNQYGIMLGSASGNNLTANIITSTKFGAYAIQLNRASNNIIKGNQIASLAEGIGVIDELLSQNAVIISKNNSILENSIVNISDKAVWFKFTKENLMVGNNVTNSMIGVAIFETDNNGIYQNNFINNSLQVAAGPEPMWSGGNEIRYSICQWDNGREGNYWSNYNGTDANHNGIGDIPYAVSEKNTDNYPLINQHETPLITPLASDTNFPSPTPSAPPPKTTPPNAQSLLVGQVVAASASATVFIVGLLIFHKKSKH